MEKTTNIMLGGIRFETTEEAFVILDTYLRSLTAHFELDPDKDEIIKDIESRIAEKFSEKKTVLDVHTVTTVLDQMGAPEAISSDEPGVHTETTLRKLYRDQDSAIIAGVASGIGAYLGIDPLLIRLAFIFSIFLGGFGILLYVLLWLLVPQAVTASQKLEMRGNAVNVGSVTGLIRDRSTEISNNGFFRRLVYFPFEVLASLLRGIWKLSHVLQKLFGILLCVGSFFAILGITALAVFALSNMNASYIELPLLEAVSSMTLIYVITAYYFTAMIPFLFLFAWGQLLVRTGLRIPSALGFGLVGIWSLAVIASGVLSFNVASLYGEYLENAPEYKQITQNIEGDFTSIKAVGHVEVRLSDAEGPSTIEGYRHDLDRAVYSIDNGVLTIESRPMEDNCFFCDSDELIVTITNNDITMIDITNSSLIFDDLTTQSLQIQASDSWIRGNLEVTDLNIEGTSLSIDLIGSASSTTLNLEHSIFSGPSFAIEDADLELREYTEAQAWVSGTLEDYVDETSTLELRGASSTQLQETEQEEISPRLPQAPTTTPSTSLDI